jgi:hypothetical protein
MTQSTHETLERSGREPEPGSERSFGLVMAGALALLALASLWRGGQAWPWTASLAALFLSAALVAPSLLKGLNWAWFKLGMALHFIVSPIVMTLLFFGTVLPVGLVLRAAGKDILRLRRDPECTSYWIERAPPGPAPGSMTEQF